MSGIARVSGSNSVTNCSVATPSPQLFSTPAHRSRMPSCPWFRAAFAHPWFFLTDVFVVTVTAEFSTLTFWGASPRQSCPQTFVTRSGPVGVFPHRRSSVLGHDCLPTLPAHTSCPTLPVRTLPADSMRKSSQQTHNLCRLSHPYHSHSVSCPNGILTPQGSAGVRKSTSSWHKTPENFVGCQRSVSTTVWTSKFVGWFLPVRWSLDISGDSLSTCWDAGTHDTYMKPPLRQVAWVDVCGARRAAVCAADGVMRHLTLATVAHRFGWSCGSPSFGCVADGVYETPIVPIASVKCPTSCKYAEDCARHKRTGRESVDRESTGSRQGVDRESASAPPTRHQELLDSFSMPNGDTSSALLEH